MSINNGLPRMVRISSIILKQDTHEIILSDLEESITGNANGEKITLHIRSRITTPLDVTPRASVIGILVIPGTVLIDLSKPENVTIFLDTSEGNLSFPLFPSKPLIIMKESL